MPPSLKDKEVLDRMVCRDVGLLFGVSEENGTHEPETVIGCKTLAPVETVRPRSLRPQSRGTGKPSLVFDEMSARHLIGRG
jgi:hypothetical protein